MLRSTYNVERLIKGALSTKDYDKIKNVTEDLKPFNEITKEVFSSVAKFSETKPENYMNTISAITEMYGEYAYLYKNLKQIELALSIVSEKGICDYTESELHKSTCEDECCEVKAGD